MLLEDCLNELYEAKNSGGLTLVDLDTATTAEILTFGQQLLEARRAFDVTKYMQICRNLQKSIKQRGEDTDATIANG